MLNSLGRACKRWAFISRLLLLQTALTFLASAQIYHSATVDEGGQLHIALGSGKELQPRKAEGQLSFGEPHISPDQRTVGWLVLYPYPDPNGADSTRPIPGELVIYRENRTIHTFSTDQIFWDWQFQDGGKLVAYSTGPTHGGAAECVLRDTDSGKVMDHWWVGSGKPPSWTQGL